MTRPATRPAVFRTESVEQYLVRHADTELRSLRRRLKRDPEWEAGLQALRVSNSRRHRERPPWLPRRPRGRRQRWLRDLYTLTAIDRLRAERGLSARAAAKHVASVLLAGPWAPERIADVFDELFPSTVPADLSRSLPENLRNAYEQRRQR